MFRLRLDVRIRTYAETFIVMQPKYTDETPKVKYLITSHKNAESHNKRHGWCLMLADNAYNWHIIWHLTVSHMLNLLLKVYCHYHIFYDKCYNQNAMRYFEPWPQLNVLPDIHVFLVSSHMFSNHDEPKPCLYYLNYIIILSLAYINIFLYFTSSLKLNVMDFCRKELFIGYSA